MTQKNIHKIVDKQEQDGEHSTIIAGKLVRLDDFKMGAKDWLNQSGSQSDRLSFEEIEKFHTSVLDTFKVLATYLRILEIAKHQHNERNNE